MKENKMILPIGSVIITKEGNIPLMVVSRGTLFEEEGKVGYFDYSAVPYPQGVTDDETYAFFNHEDIEDVIYFGYINSDEQIFAENYHEMIANSGYEKMSLSEKTDITSEIDSTRSVGFE